MTETTQEIIERVGLIPVLRARNVRQAHAIVQAMLAGGVTVVEVTMTVPGALTPTEVVAAYRAGADYVKIFPCSAMGGASYLKSLLAPFPFLKLIPTGGVTLETAESFLRAGARALGVGSDLVDLAAIDKGRPETITETARAYLHVIAKMRRELHTAQ